MVYFNYCLFLIAAIRGIRAPKKIGTKIIIGNPESFELKGAPELLDRIPAIKRIKKITIPINNKKTLIMIRTGLSNLY